VALSNASGSGVVLSSPSTVIVTINDNDTVSGTNPIGSSDFFVRQHYLDFLNREPDPDGWAYWTNELTKCAGAAACLNDRRIGVSASFFVEQEFQDTGSFVYRLYKASYGRQPRYKEFTTDRRKVIGGSALETAKEAFAESWIQRPEFLQEYPADMSHVIFVNKLFDAAGLTGYATDREQQIRAMSDSGRSRAQVLRNVIEIQDFKTREYNPSFVLMQYFGYLKRDPEPEGYNFWLNVLNNDASNNYRGMVCAFITSAEYQDRFGISHAHSNADCGQ
jgi:hypothetical protein